VHTVPTGKCRASTTSPLAIFQTKKALIVAQKELEVRSSLTPVVELQKWLQITYELELKAYNEQKSLAEQQLFNAKVSLINYFRVDVS